MNGALFSYRSNINSLPLKDNYFICYNGYSKPAILNKAAIDLASFFDRPRPLNDIPMEWIKKFGDKVVKKALRKMMALDFLVPETAGFSHQSCSASILYAWLHVSDRCNLRCDYCYLPHHKLDMSLEIGQSSIDATFRSALLHNFQYVGIKYAGGEAMLRFDFIKTIHRYARDQSKKLGLGLYGIVLSNGTRLIPENLEILKEMELNLTISLDGIGEDHDRQRRYINGKGSFKDVSNGINLALKHGIIPTISVTVSGRNAAKLPKLVSWLLRKNLPFQINFYRENDYSKSHEDLQLEQENIIQGLLATYKIIEDDLPNRNLLNALLDRSNLSGAHIRSCGVGQNYLVFDYLGRVSKCQMQMNSSVASVEVEDPLSYVQNDKIGIQNVAVEEKEGCRDCEWKYWCSGGCPAATFRATGRYDIKSPNCEIYKALFPEVLRLEGLRLLKYGEKTREPNSSPLPSL